jgi:purine nucleosidase
MPKPIIIDCDPGIDDAIALMLASASPELSVQAVTVSYGNVGLEHTLRNALAICELVGLDVPVYAGADRPLVRGRVMADEYHGQSGLGTIALPRPSRTAAPGRAVDAIIEACLSTPGAVTLVAIGAMTNVALALRLEPRLSEAVGQIVFMAGSTDEGNTSPAAEFNAFADPHALRVVLESGVPLTMFGLNVTHQVLSTPDRVAAIRALDNPVSSTAAAMLEHFSGAYRDIYGWPGAALHDPCTIAYLLDPTLFTTCPMHVAIDTDEGANFGRTTCDLRNLTGEPPNVRVALNADHDRVFSLLTAHLGKFV